MRKIQLTRGYVALIDAEDFERVNQFNWYAQGNPKTGVYAARRDKQTRKMVYMHRFVLSAPSELDVDHRDTLKKLDNRRTNLRLATPSQNGANSKKSQNRSSRFKGVSWVGDRQKWDARIKCNNRQIILGNHATEEGAARAYDVAATKFFGEFAALNFPVKCRE